jgi:hypothetical protein
MFQVHLSTTDTNTPGTLRVMMAEAATFLPVWDDYTVIPHELWDTLFVTQPTAAINKFFDKATPTGTVNSLPDAVAGATNGLFIAGTNAATIITTSLTTTFTGNLTGSVDSVTDAVVLPAISNNWITAAGIADGAIDMATFASDVGTTAFASNAVALAVFKALDSAITDAVSLTAGGLLEKVRRLTWVLTNKIDVTDANGNTVVYKDDSTTAAYTVNAALVDNSTTTTRLRMA